MSIDVKWVHVGSARKDLSDLMRKSALTEKGYFIHNARSPRATALLIDPQMLQRRKAHARPARTLAQVIERLPFRSLGGNPLVQGSPLSDDELRRLRIPGVEHVPTKDSATRPKGDAR